MSNLYKVSEGVVSQVSDGTQLDHLADLKVDWSNEVLCYSKTPEGALLLAEQYDNGKIHSDNLFFWGVTLVALQEPEQMYMNPNTGSFDTQDGWCYMDEEGINHDPVAEDDGLIPVVKDQSGDWVEGTVNN